MASTSSTQKSLDRFQRTIESGAYYEAQQVLKTVYHRHRARKQLENSYQLLVGGACIQLEHGQVTCGSELAQMLIDAYMADGVAVTPQSMQGVLSIIDTFGNTAGAAAANGTSADGTTAALAAGAAGGAGEDGGDGGAATPLEQVSRLGTAAVRWVLKYGDTADAQQLHDRLAAAMWKAQGWRALAAATPHFIRGSSMDPFAEAVREAASEAGRPEEEDLFVCRSVLQLLATSSSKAMPQGHQGDKAAIFLMHYYGNSVGLPETPLLHFAQLAIEAVRAGLRGSQLYRMVLDMYSPAHLAVDPGLVALAGRVRDLHFPAPGGGGGMLGGMLGDMMKQMMAGMGDENDE